MGYVSWRVNHWIFWLFSPLTSILSTFTYRPFAHVAPGIHPTPCGVETKGSRFWEAKIADKNMAKKGSLRHEAEYPHINQQKSRHLQVSLQQKSSLHSSTREAFEAPKGCLVAILQTACGEAMVRHIWETYEDVLTS